MKLAIVLSTYNRCKKTKTALDGIIGSINKYDNAIRYHFFVCDDASSDGTCEMLNTYDYISVIHGTGKLFWCKSMHRAMQVAKAWDADFYLMINDDVEFNENVIEVMFSSYAQIGGIGGICGSTLDSNRLEFTYGGREKDNTPIVPTGSIQPCYWTNWNCFLIDREVVNIVGLIDSKYQHSFGDYDYSFRMNKAGIPVMVATDYVGTCDRNVIKNTFRSSDVSRFRRFKMLFSPKGMPILSYMHFNLNVNGKKYFLRYLWGYFSLIAYIMLGRDLNE